MSVIKEPHQFIIDGEGKRIAVILDIDQYEHLRDASEELEDIRAFDEAKASDDDIIPFEQALEEIERIRR